MAADPRKHPVPLRNRKPWLCRARRHFLCCARNLLLPDAAAFTSPPSSRLSELGVPVLGNHWDVAQHPEVLCHPLNFESDGSGEILELTKLSTTAARQGPTEGCRGGYVFPKKGKVNLYGAGTPAGSTTVAGAHRALASFVQARRREETGGRERAHRGGHIFHLQCIFPTPPSKSPEFFPGFWEEFF